MYKFTALIYKVGINPCVDVPSRITKSLTAKKGYIPIKGTINAFFFQQTLCPVKDGLHRLYVNGPMLKGGEVEVGNKASFIIEQDDTPKTEVAVPEFLVKALKKHRLTKAFEALIPSRQKEISKYLSYLKTDEARDRNLEKFISKLKEGKPMWDSR